MEIIRIEATKSTPYVEFDPVKRKLAIHGQSYPENAFKFFESILNTVDQFLGQANGKDSIQVELQLSYINTSSTKCLIMLLEKYEDAYRRGLPVEVVWFYDPNNESELECAEEFKEDLELPFEIVPKEL